MKFGCTSAWRSLTHCFVGSGVGVCALAVFTVGCGTSADNAPADQNLGGAAGFVQGAGGQQPAGGSTGNGGGGFQQGAGGFQQGAGGFQQGAGGFQQGAGGFQQGAGGFQQGNGGVQQGNGGVQQGNGGVQQGSGGGGGGSPGAAGPCVTDPTQEAAILGDSYVTGFGSPALQPSLAAIISSIGQYPNYAGAGCSMATGGICTGAYGNVPQQGSTARQQHPNLKFVIMDGGGNDILICDATAYPGCSTTCSKAGSSTQKVCTDIVAKAMSTAGQLMTDSANAGIRDVIYFFYPHIPAAGPGMGGYDEILDYSEPLAKNLCDSAESNTGGKLRCHFVDLVQPFIAAGGDKNVANFAADGIHPSAAGQQIIATQITNVMKSACLGQASGCCTP